MTVLLITYDLNREGENYKETDDKVLKIMHKNYENRKLSESSYAIATSDDPDVIYNKFKDVLDKDDAFYVIKLTKPKSGYLKTETKDWINKNID